MSTDKQKPAASSTISEGQGEESYYNSLLTPTQQDIIEAARYGFRYATESQHHGEVPNGNILQWWNHYNANKKSQLSEGTAKGDCKFPDCDCEQIICEANKGGEAI